MHIKKQPALLFLGITILFTASTSATYAQETDPATPQEIEVHIREYFADIPVMIEIARCESKFRQFTDAGNVLRGGYGQEMIGVFQFYEAVHAARAQTLGHDLLTVDGNLAYARHLYTESGTEPWDSSRDCFAATTTSPSAQSDTIEAAMTDAQLREKIALLQQIITLLQTLLALQQA